MARFLADEHFDARVQDCLRRLGHDVEPLRRHDAVKSGSGISDEEVLQIAAQENRIVLTENKKDFKALHDSRSPVKLHKGIIACSNHDLTPRVLANCIDKAVKEREKVNQHFKQQFILLDGTGAVVPSKRSE